MHEDVLAAVRGGDEPEALGAVEPVIERDVSFIHHSGKYRIETTRVGAKDTENFRVGRCLSVSA